MSPRLKLRSSPASFTTSKRTNESIQYCSAAVRSRAVRAVQILIQAAIGPSFSRFSGFSDSPEKITPMKKRRNVGIGLTSYFIRIFIIPHYSQPPPTSLSPNKQHEGLLLTGVIPPLGRKDPIVDSRKKAGLSGLSWSIWQRSNAFFSYEGEGKLSDRPFFFTFFKN